jgi:hypothetical protein
MTILLNAPRIYSSPPPKTLDHSFRRLGRAFVRHAYGAFWLPYPSTLDTVTLRVTPSRFRCSLGEVWGDRHKNPHITRVK